MCTLVLLFRPGNAFPVLAAANRDEVLARPWRAPDAHWPAQPGVVGGLDCLGGGTWLAVRRDGVLAALLNRTGSLGPAAGKSSRGLLPLLALRHADAAAAAAALAAASLAAWRSFNLVVADRRSAWCVSWDGSAGTLSPLEPGLHMITAGDPDDPADPRIARHLPRFAAAEAPVPPDWKAWPALLGDAEGDPGTAMHLTPRDGFGTGSACLLSIGAAVHFSFAAGSYDSGDFQPVPAGPLRAVQAGQQDAATA